MDIRQTLESTPQWSSMSAYDRALLCCQVLDQWGQAIPGWMQIRQWIGKGSANDIHRAKQDFLAQQSGEGMSIETATKNRVSGELPVALSGSLQHWWQQLQQEATAAFEQERLAYQQRIDEQAIQLEQQQAHSASLLAHLEDLQQQLEHVKQQLTDAQAAQRMAEDRALTATSALRQAVQDQQAWQQQLAEQWQAHQNAQQQAFDTGLAQLEGTQQFALQQIEQTRLTHQTWQQAQMAVIDQWGQGMQTIEQNLQQILQQTRPTNKTGETWNRRWQRQKKRMS